MIKLKHLEFSAGEMLTRAQLKNVMGGKLPSGPCVWSGSCTNFPSTQYTQGADKAQSDADGWCASASCCDNVDCPGAA